MARLSLLAVCILAASLLCTVEANDDREQIQQLIANNHIMVFSKSYCPYCKRVKALFDRLGKKYHKVELDQRPDGRKWQGILMELTGQRTVPNVFIGTKHIGGHDDTFRLHNGGKLEPMLK